MPHLLRNVCNPEQPLFINREKEQQAFRRLLDLPAGRPLPFLMFHGREGIGKSWLLDKLRAELPAGLPSALLDFESQPIGSLLPRDQAQALAELRQQFAAIECPRFDLAYSFLRFRQGVKDEPLLQAGGLAGASSKALAQLTASGAGNFYDLAAFVERVGANLGQTLPGGRLAEEETHQDVLRLRRMAPEEIYTQLADRFLRDLGDGLPLRAGRTCRGVIFLDGTEVLEARLHGAQVHLTEHWLGELHHAGSPVLVVLAGRRRLPVEESGAGPFDPPAEQHALGGIPEPAARALLAQTGADAVLIHKVLRASLYREPTGAASCHPVSLGLSVDLLCKTANLDHSGFAPAGGDWIALVQHFLKSLASAVATLLLRLAATPRFDEPAARDAFPALGDVPPEDVWELVGNFPFVRDAAEPWRAIHPCMRRALAALNPEREAEDHCFWCDYWRQRSRSEIDDFAALAWHHQYALALEAARGEWKPLAVACRQAGRMAEHYRLLGWWGAIDLEVRASAFPRNSDALIVSALGTTEAADPRFEPLRCARADALVELGMEYFVATLGLRSENVRRTIGCYEAALEVYTRASYLPQWAVLQNNLGTAYEALEAGNRADNLRKAIGCYESALEVYTEAGQPEQWAATLNNLGTAYADLPSGDRGENLRHAIACHEAALRVHTEAEHPVHWAEDLTNLGAVYADLPAGDRGENLSRAIACYESALRVHSQSRDLGAWAATQNNLGVAYKELPSGDREENIRRAIICFEAALGVHTEAEQPSQWAAAQNNLGSAYEMLQSGDREENLRQAIACYEAALRVYTEEEHPAQWATIQNNLGAAYTDLAAVDGDENLEKAVACYEAALRVRTETDYPPQWAATQNNLGVAYEDMPSGDRGDNLRRTIGCFEAALRVLTEEDYPADWSMTQDNLGTALEELAVLTGDDALGRRAAACFEAAARGYRRAGFAEDAEALRDRASDARKRFS